MGNSSWRTILVRLGAARIAYSIAKTDYHVVSTVVSDHYEPMQLNLWLQYTCFILCLKSVYGCKPCSAGFCSSEL